MTRNYTKSVGELAQDNIKSVVDSNFAERETLTPLEEAVRKELFFVLARTGRSEFFPPYLLESLNSKNDNPASFVKEKNLISFERSDELTKLTNQTDFSVNDLIKLFPDVVKQKYVWSDRGGKLYREDSNNNFYSRDAASLQISTAQELAIAYGSVYDVITMTENGLEVNPISQSGENSLLAIASKLKRQDVVDYLKAKGAQETVAMSSSPPKAKQVPAGKLPVASKVVGQDIPQPDSIQMYNNQTLTSSYAKNLEPSAPSEEATPHESDIAVKKTSNNASYADPVEPSAPPAEETPHKSQTSNIATRASAIYKVFKSADYDHKITKDYVSLSDEEKLNTCNLLLYYATKSKTQTATLKISGKSNSEKKIFTISDLLTMGANPNYVNPESRSGSTPLLNIMKNNAGYTIGNVVKLVEAGADVNYINNDGLSPISSVDIRRSSKDTKIISAYLLVKGANPNQRSNKVRPTPLYGALEVIKENSGSHFDQDQKRARAEARKNAFEYCHNLVKSGAQLDETFIIANAYVSRQVNTLDLVKKLHPEKSTILVRAAIRNGQDINLEHFSNEILSSKNKLQLQNIIREEAKTRLFPRREYDPLLTGHYPQYYSSPAIPSAILIGEGEEQAKHQEGSDKTPSAPPPPQEEPNYKLSSEELEKYHKESKKIASAPPISDQTPSDQADTNSLNYLSQEISTLSPPPPPQENSDSTILDLPQAPSHKITRRSDNDKFADKVQKKIVNQPFTG